MDHSDTPKEYADVQELLTEDGFSIGQYWYHGTSSGLVPSILKQGLVGDGDKDTSDRFQQTLGTIGNRQFETSEPVFLTQSKELAYYWAKQKTHTRNLYFRKGEEPTVIQVDISSDEIKPDAGAIAILLEPTNAYIAFLKEVYKKKGVAWREENPLELEREFFIHSMGMAYTPTIIPPERLNVL